MKVIRQDKDIHESVMDEYARYLAMKNQADLAYVAMMNGIELEEERCGQDGEDNKRRM